MERRRPARADVVSKQLVLGLGLTICAPRMRPATRLHAAIGYSST